MEQRSEQLVGVERDPVRPGAIVMVRNAFDTWSPGFQVVDRADTGYRVCRVSDGEMLPRVFSRRELRVR